MDKLIEYSRMDVYNIRFAKHTSPLAFNFLCFTSPNGDDSLSSRWSSSLESAVENEAICVRGKQLYSSA